MRRSADVLVVEGSSDERNHSAETRSESLRMEVAAEELDQLLRGHRRELLDADFIGMYEPAPLRDASSSRKASILRS
jgi:hypothetical protein